MFQAAFIKTNIRRFEAIVRILSGLGFFPIQIKTSTETQGCSVKDKERECEIKVRDH